VVPDLRGKRAEIARIFGDVLSPGEGIVASQSASRDPSAATPSELFNITLGVPLNECALVNDALGLIEFALGRPLAFDSVSALLRSPHIAAAEREMSARAALDAALRESIGPQLDIASLNRRLQPGRDRRLQQTASGASVLCALVDALASTNRRARSANASATAVRGKVAAAAAATSDVSPRSAKGPAEWAQLFSGLLSQWGFPGERPLDSVTHQLLAKFREAVQQLASMQVVQPRLREDEALASLRRILVDTVFQPESDAELLVPVQVMGVLESAGQRFDRLWVTGLTESAWPLAARPNPFIPAALQRRAGIPEASAAASLALDETITAGWMRAASEVVFSHARHAADAAEAPRMASALTRGVSLAETLGAPVPPTYAEALLAANAAEDLQPIPDQPLPLLPAPTSVGGGASLMRDQAACPARAFARHRLGAKPLNTPQPGLDAAERGILLHRVLSAVWTTIGRQSSLLAMSDADLRVVVGDAVDKAIAASYASGSENLVGRFAGIERDRFMALVLDWLQLERRRTPFEVVACERAKQVTLGPLAMSLRLDRMDCLADGTYALIDYKSGNASAKSWLGERPDEPQLPLYWRTADEEISVLAFARLKRGKAFGFEGVSAVEGVLPNVGPIEARRGMPAAGYVSWDVLTQEWESSLANLASEFQRGIATVDPKLGGLTCKQCDLHTLCRVAEYTGAGIDEELGGDGAPDEADDV
jgi:probable DNA repair protein